MRLKLLIEYDGSDYGGWQQQKNAKTIAGEILRVAGQIFPGVPLELHGAGRTDAGVHARGQVAHIDLPETLPLETLHVRMNDFLPADINLLKIEEVHARFHARHHAKARHYTYQISRRRDALNRRQVWWVKERLDLALMGEAAAKLVGFHDFVSFSDEKPASPETAPDPARPNEKSTWVNLTHCGLVERDDLLLLEISGTHFLRKMVRRLVGNLVVVGTGKLSPAQMAAHLKTPSRVPAAHTAPPAGLFLTRVDY